MIKQLNKLKGYASLNKVAIIAVGISLAFIVPVTAYVTYRIVDNDKQKITDDVQPEKTRSLLGQSGISKIDTNNDSETPTESQGDSDTIANTTEQPRTTTTPRTNSSQQQVTEKPQPKPEPKPKPEPEPDYLTTCWIESPSPRQYCPYSPPSSWSNDFLKYPCQKAGYGTVPCPSYQDVRIIEGNNGGQCYFYFYTDRVQRLVYTSPDTSGTTANCLTATPKSI